MDNAQNPYLKAVDDLNNIVGKLGQDVAPRVEVYAVTSDESGDHPFRLRRVRLDHATSQGRAFDNETFAAALAEYGIQTQVASTAQPKRVDYGPIERLFDERGVIGIGDIGELCASAPEDDGTEHPRARLLDHFCDTLAAEPRDRDRIADLIEGEVPFAIGLAFRYATNKEGTGCLWGYQRLHRAPAARRSGMVIMSSGATELYFGESIKIEGRFDFIICGNTLYTRALDVLRSQFGFNYLTQELAINAAQTLTDIVSDEENVIIDSIFKYQTCANKMLKVARDESPVLSMAAPELHRKIEQMPEYSDKFEFDEVDRLEIHRKRDVTRMLDMMSDNILISPLTGATYECRSKKRIDH